MQSGDVVYCDPPYTPLSKSANFTQYGPNRFDQSDHQDLVTFAKSLAKQGIPVLISNHDTKEVRQLYRGAQITSLQVQRYISCLGHQRKKVAEIFALFS